MTEISAAFTLSQPRARVDRPASRELISRPYEVRVDYTRRGRFEDLRDAIGSAKIAKRESPRARVTVADALAGYVVVEIEG